MRQSSTRSLLTLAAIIPALIAVDAPARSQSLRTPPTVEISRPNKTEITSGKKASFVRMFEDIAIAPSFTPKAIELRGISGGDVKLKKHRDVNLRKQATVLVLLTPNPTTKSP